MFYDKLTDTFRVWVRLDGILTDVYKSLCLMSLNKTESRVGTGELGTTQGRSLRTNAPDTPLGLPRQHTLTESWGFLPHNSTHGLYWTHKTLVGAYLLLRSKTARGVLFLKNALKVFQAFLTSQYTWARNQKGISFTPVSIHGEKRITDV